jgi:prepilin-type processing-associated H-X9-DG protein
VRSGYLYVSTVDGLPGAVKQVENKLPSITENDNFKKAMAALPQGVKPLSISYSNPVKTYPEIRRLGLGLLPVARAAGVDLPTSLLPDVDDLSAFLTPGASISWADNDGFHMAGRTAFPGAEMLGGLPGGQAGVATAAMGTALALPALAQARYTAKRTADATSLRQIVHVSHMHAAENNGRFPDGLERLVAGNALDPRLLTSPLSGRSPLQMDADLRKLAADDFASFSKTIAAHSDFAYIGSQMSATTSNASSLILAYDKPSPALRGGMNVAFADGHIEFVRWQNLDTTFALTNDYLKSKGLPVIDTTDLIQKSGARP